LHGIRDGKVEELINFEKREEQRHKKIQIHNENEDKKSNFTNEVKVDESASDTFYKQSQQDIKKKRKKRKKKGNANDGAHQDKSIDKLDVPTMENSKLNDKKYD
jgi:hypothetical protein